MYYSKHIPPHTSRTTDPGNEHRGERYHLSSDFSPEEIRVLRVSLANSLYMLRRKFRARHPGKDQPGSPDGTKKDKLQRFTERHMRRCEPRAADLLRHID